MMHRPKRTPIADLNHLLTCKLCNGYFIDATTIIECLHSCKNPNPHRVCACCLPIAEFVLLQFVGAASSVISRRTSTVPFAMCRFTRRDRCSISVRIGHCRASFTNSSPSCFKVTTGFRLSNKSLNSLLFSDEMQRRKDFYTSHPEAKPSGSEQNGVFSYQHLLSADETVCLSLSYQGNKETLRYSSHFPLTRKHQLDYRFFRYLRCPAAVTIGHLEKLIRAKYELAENHRIEVLYNEDCLSSHLSLMDVAYIYLWRRVCLNVDGSRCAFVSLEYSFRKGLWN